MDYFQKLKKLFSKNNYSLKIEKSASIVLVLIFSVIYFHNNSSTVSKKANIVDYHNKTILENRNNYFIQDEVEISLVNYLNKIKVEELTNIKSIGIISAKKIITFRDKNYPLHDVNMLLGIQGIGIKKQDLIREYLKSKSELK